MVTYRPGTLVHGMNGRAVLSNWKKRTAQKLIASVPAVSAARHDIDRVSYVDARRYYSRGSVPRGLPYCRRRKRWADSIVNGDVFMPLKGSVIIFRGMLYYNTGNINTSQPQRGTEECGRICNINNTYQLASDGPLYRLL